ncbi:fumarylacetoacetate hydrolase family protein [Amycolatopsis sacchari]|uniref:2-keto-4-pentenoate hydratase/2-oxohepta-3-ene-1,7-dioic acid hydratase (Catechol pathway) n=1 Tax=Amycolatopsis sacchari TaxID=115433 RepID=A0A1I4DJ83_9PSEU|nr:fumarylacetoacetate hydrolase family protein [Amycolatopsis sacchari]SFK93163.1 2-keto-4-pentenoate hydratase/2-oxohepta-3-ene-1,7-dioic acid hydratase (catechol pathway) [Amycolatopsis sacchari]
MSEDPVTRLFGRRPGKVIAVHLSYASRAAQRGRTPAHPSYFLKTSSSVTGPGTVERPEGTELLGFEGEIALVLGKAARRVSPGDAWACVGWVTAANDLGLHDLRKADRGSNVRSKGGDGYTPLGPDLIPADRLDPARIGVRTWLDGALVQDDSSAGMLFPFALMLADLSRVMTLEPGDVVLTGTPAGASVAEPGQRIEVEVFSLDAPGVTSGRLTTEVVAAPALPSWGSPSEVDDAQRADAWGTPPAPVLTDDLRTRLGRVAVATLSVQLRKRGYDDSSIDGVRPLVPGTRLVGTARTLRYVPYRKDLFAAHGGGYNAQKRAIDSLGPGDVLVMEARGDATAGTIGDILALRAQVRGAAGVITDGAVRDARPLTELGLPVYCAGHHPAVLGRRHVPWETDTTISCGGATVQPGDVIVADDDGALVIPPGLVEEVLTAAEAQEEEEAFIAEMVGRGESVAGLYPLDAAWRRRFETWRADQRTEGPR